MLIWGLPQDMAEDSVAAWGTRAIWKDDFIDVFADRTSFFYSDYKTQELLKSKMAVIGLRFSDINTKLKEIGHTGSSCDIVTIYEDDDFIFKCSANGSHGYLYMTAKLKETKMDTDNVENVKPVAVIRKNFRWSDSVPTAKPGRKQSKSKWQPVADRIRKDKKNAGRWALVAHGVYFTDVSRLKKAYPDIDWVTRNKDENKRCDLWASLKVES